MNKTKEQIIAEAKEWRKTAPVMPIEDARRLHEKWIASDENISPDVIQDK